MLLNFVFSFPQFEFSVFSLSSVHSHLFPLILKLLIADSLSLSLLLPDISSCMGFFLSTITECFLMSIDC